ncbi:hypothetical protein DITRI_Ditri13aG0132800 [Diplodiscus trichospermus]
MFNLGVFLGTPTGLDEGQHQEDTSFAGVESKLYFSLKFAIVVTAIVAGMLNKFLNVHKLAPFSSRGRPKKPVAQPRKELGEHVQETSSALKIVHVGGVVECYYMAIPAVNIMEKYPTLILARPQVFWRPWDSLVRSDEILTPGEKFYLVPRSTVRKLRRRIKKPNGDHHVSVNSFVSQTSSIDVSKDGFSSTSFLQRNEASDRSSEVSGLLRTSRNKNRKKKHVTFVGVDAKQKDEGIAEITKKKSNLESQAGKRKSRNGVLWQPSLTAISERHGPGE